MGIIATRSSQKTPSPTSRSGSFAQGSGSSPRTNHLSVQGSNEPSSSEIKRQRSSTLPISSLFTSRREDDDAFQTYTNSSKRSSRVFTSNTSPNSPHRSSSTKLQIASSIGGSGLQIESPADTSDTEVSFTTEAFGDVAKCTNTVNLSYDEEGNKMINRYTMISTLGKGSYGKVKLVLDDNNKPFAMKIMNKAVLKKIKKSGGGNLLMDVQREIAIMKKLSHPNVVKLFEIIDDHKNDLLYLVIEYAENGAMLTMSETNTGETKPCKFRLNQIRKYMKQVIEGLQYLQ